MMYKADLLCKIDLDYQTKYYKPLAEIGTSSYDSKKKKYTWIFKARDLPKVVAILAKPLIVNSEDAEQAWKYADQKKEVIKQAKKYGDGFVNVKLHPELPNWFQITIVRERKPSNINVSFETVNALWSVIKNQPVGKKVLTATVAQNHCNALGIVDFNTGKNGAFNWKYFMGSRKIYLVFYAAIKVLQSYGAVEHIIQASKSGISRRLDKWSIQTELDFMESFNEEEDKK